MLFLLVNTITFTNGAFQRHLVVLTDTELENMLLPVQRQTPGRSPSLLLNPMMTLDDC